MKRPLSEWGVFGVLIRSLVVQLVSCELKLVIPVEPNRKFRNIEICESKLNLPYFQYNFNLIFMVSFCSGDFIECVEIDYDPKKISYIQLLQLFWNNHEYGLTTRVKRQYSSLILYHNDQQKSLALKSINEEKIKRSPEVIITEIKKAGPFYPAEECV